MPPGTAVTLFALAVLRDPQIEYGFAHPKNQPAGTKRSRQFESTLELWLSKTSGIGIVIGDRFLKSKQTNDGETRSRYGGLVRIRHEFDPA